jgi:hypothetical protein
MVVKHGWVESFHDDELVVGLAELSVVQTVLADLGVRWGDSDISTRLGLARLSGLDGVTSAARGLLDDSRVREALRRFQEERQAAHPEAPHVSDLALLIQGIRLLFAREYPGWQITIGKNYRPSMLQGYPHIGGEGEPTPGSNSLTPPAGVPGFGPPGPHMGAARVGLLDTRLFRHESLANRYYARDGDLLAPGADSFTEFDGHCTFVASCILRQAPHAELYLRHVLDHEGNGTAWHAAVAIAEMAQLGLDVVNLSFGEFMTDDDTAPAVLAAAIRCFGPETVVVAAAGNNGYADQHRPEGTPRGVTSATAAYPAALPGVVGVGAINADGKLAPFTPNPAPWISLYARGVDLTEAYLRGNVAIVVSRDADGKVTETREQPFHGTANWAGCSFAAGIVTGAIAAGAVPGQRSAREALNLLLSPERGKGSPDILPHDAVR